MHIHFSYGSNMDVAAMRQRCPQARPLGLAEIEGWEFFIAASGYASLRRNRATRTYGVLWRLTDIDLAALDLYEDVASGLYRKARFRIVGSGFSAIVYLTRDARRGRAHPAYQEGIVAAATTWGFPHAALRRLASWLPSRRRF